MILALVAKGKKTIACIILSLIYLETVIPSYALDSSRHIHPSYRHENDGTAEDVHLHKKAPAAVASPAIHVPAAKKTTDIGGPTQPEAQAFHSVNNDNMVDLFSGDFNYNIPLLDVGGYPVAIGYSSGISMDQEASWVGLGWNINPGTITRNLRGLPDDFNGTDSITKTATIKENKTIGVTAGDNIEIAGMPIISPDLGVNVGVLHNSYKGWGLEAGVSPSLNSAKWAGGTLTAGLSLTNSSQNGFTITPTLSMLLGSQHAMDNGHYLGNLSVGLPYNSRGGMKALQFSAGLAQYKTNENNKNELKRRPVLSSYISFATPSFTPTINLPYTSYAYTVTLKVGGETKVLHPSLYISGYISKQYIADRDKTLSLPAFGYLNYQNGAKNPEGLMDYNREKEIPYRDKPELPNIAIPSYTYDVFSMSGEGTGGSFRAYRSDIGYVYDHHMKSRDISGSASLDFGGGDIVHGGADLNFTYASTESGPWKSLNPLGKTIAFTNNNGNYEAAYFRNPGEMAINNRNFYNAIGGDDVVAPRLLQSGGSSYITTTNALNRYINGINQGSVPLTAATAVKQTRDKRTQLISYLNAGEASEAGLGKYIENYKKNTYTLANCEQTFPTGELDGPGTGLHAVYGYGPTLEYTLFERLDPEISFENGSVLNARPGKPANITLDDWFAIRWTGLIKAPVSGAYNFYTRSDDGARVIIEGIHVIDLLKEGHDLQGSSKEPLYLEKDHFYHIQVDFSQYGGKQVGCYLYFDWSYPGAARHAVPTEYLYPLPTLDTFPTDPAAPIHKELRVNRFRKSNHLSEISVLNKDGKRYIYGLPVYNLKQKEVSFSVNHANGNAESGMVKYTSRLDANHSNDAEDSITNNSGNDHYFSSEETPAYAHSFLLTGVVSPDYVDVTGDGISDDDLGDAVKFNYTKIAGVNNPYEWRTPYSDSANYNEGLKTDTRDDKASYIYGQKELWYLNSIESKNMIATFKLGAREDLVPINERGVKDTGYHVAQKLEEINLYTKADFLKHGTNATPVKTVHFDYSYELCKGINKPKNNVGKLTLKRIWFTYNGNNKKRKNPYVFKYHPNNPDYNVRSYDRWGNYKDPSQNPGYTTSNHITNAEYPYALQDSAKAAYNAAAWTLDTIILPSGGRMTMTYESDDYAYVQNRRAAQMMQIAGFSPTQPTSATGLSNYLYGQDDYLYVIVNVPSPVTSKQEVYYKYLEGNDTMFFRLNVKMPSDKFGRGYEYVPCYGRLEKGEYGLINSNTIWVKLQGINGKGETGGSFSPLAKAAVQFLRLNLPSKAYPGSDVGDNLDLADGVKVMFSMTSNIINTFSSFDGTARNNGWVKEVDLSRTSVRLKNPDYKKYGGGLRVKRIVINDNWNKMTGKAQKESTYGTEYSYTTIKRIHGKDIEISSGVAAYEPIMGGEENPWRMPIEYATQDSWMAPVNMGYAEQPLGETFFPGASVGYSKVRTRSIHTKKTRSANGYEESTFYTAYDFPTITDHSLVRNENKLTYKPAIGNLLRINAAHHLVMSQGFKIELNDMHGKPRSHAVYPETDSVHPISYTENYYHVDNVNSEFKHLNNTVLSMNPKGEIDTAALIGKDMELMMDMREQKSTSIGVSANINADVFSFGIPPILGWLSMIPLPQFESNLFRSAAATKVITRHGILDSVVAIDKGSKVTTSNLLYDGETGDVLLTQVQNEFGDSIYQFNYPAAWAYDGMSGAYKNIDFTISGVTIKGGKIISGLSQEAAAANFASGDEILVYARNKVTGDDCDPVPATFRSPAKIWAVDANAINGLAPDIYFMDQDGKPYSGIDVVMKTIRSGRKNISASVGTVAMLVNPLKKDGAGNYNLVIDQDSKIINASVTEYKQNWQIDDRKKSKTTCSF